MYREQRNQAGDNYADEVNVKRVVVWIASAAVQQ